jgi:hypothetical protein
VVVGDLIGSGEAQERGIVGETPNLAARLQSLASARTAPPVYGWFTEGFGTRDLKEAKGLLEELGA